MFYVVGTLPEDMDMGVSEHNPPFDVNDPQRRQELPSDMLNAPSFFPCNDNQQPNPFTFSQPLLDEAQFPGSMYDTPMQRPTQCSTPGPAVEDLRKEIAHWTLDTPDDYKEPLSVRSNVSTSTINDPVQETTIWKTAKASKAGGVSVRLHMDLHTMVENSKQQLCTGTVKPSRIHLLNNKCDTLALPASVNVDGIRCKNATSDVPFVLPGTCKLKRRTVQHC